MPLDLPGWIAPWCDQHLGAAPVELLLRGGHLSAVFGLRLGDDSQVVIKASGDEPSRVASCVAAQAALAGSGFRCPAPLTSVTSVEGDLAVHAEEWLPGGQMLRGDDPDVALCYAAVFADLMGRLGAVRVPPPLPSPYWLGWDHQGPGPWPPINELDSRDQSLVPGFVVATAVRATKRLRRSRDRPCVLGHADFEAQNMRWAGRELLVVYDWDSLAWMPEPVLVGSAAGVFANTETPTLAPLESSAAFIEAYQMARGHGFSSDEIELAWAGSLWTATHNAREQALLGLPPVAATALRAQAEARLRLANA